MIDRTLQPPVCEPDDFVMQRPECHVLPNGIPLNILNVGDSEVVRVDVLMKGGRWHQRLLLQALFTNRMLREGTLRYSSSEIAERLDYYGAWLELSCAAEYAFITLYSLNKYLPQTLDVLESMVKEPLFPEKELRIVLDNNMQQFMVNSSKVDFLAHRGLAEAIFGKHHPCGRVVQEEDYGHITREVLREFYEDYPDLAYTRKMNYVNIPFLAHLAFGKEGRGLQFFINAGPQIGFFISDSHTIGGPWDDYTGLIIEQHEAPIDNKFDYGITGGAGVELRTKIGHFQVEGRYYYALSDFYGTTKKDYFSRAAHGVITVKVAYLFDLMK